MDLAGTSGEDVDAAGGIKSAVAESKHQHLDHMLAEIRPMLRGVNHIVAFPIAVFATALLVLWSNGLRYQLGALTFGTSVSLVFGMSGMYHTLPWPARWQKWVRRMDHATIYVTTAGIYTAAWIGKLHGHVSTDALLIIVWVAAAGGVVFKMIWVDAPRRWSAFSYQAFGLTALAALPTLVATAGWTAAILLLISGAIFLTGGFIYAYQRPNPIPHIFGFHEVFHLCVTLAMAMQFVVMAMFILR